MKKKKAAAIRGRLSTLTNRLDELERKVNREQQWESWKANSSTGSSSTGFGFRPNDAPPWSYDHPDHDAHGPKEYR